MIGRAVGDTISEIPSLKGAAAHSIRINAGIVQIYRYGLVVKNIVLGVKAVFSQKLHSFFAAQLVSAGEFAFKVPRKVIVHNLAGSVIHIYIGVISLHGNTVFVPLKHKVSDTAVVIVKDKPILKLRHSGGNKVRSYLCEFLLAELGKAAVPLIIRVIAYRYKIPVETDSYTFVKVLVIPGQIVFLFRLAAKADTLRDVTAELSVFRRDIKGGFCRHNGCFGVCFSPKGRDSRCQH